MPFTANGCRSRLTVLIGRISRCDWSFLERALTTRLRPPQPCLQYWPEPGLQQFGPMTVELLSRTADDDVIIRLFRVQNIARVGGRAFIL